VGAVDVTQLLGGDPRRGDLIGGVTGAEAGQQPGVAGGGVVLGAAQQDPPDAVEGVAGSSPVPEGVGLNAAAYRVDRVLAQLDRVEGVMPTSA